MSAWRFLVASLTVYFFLEFILRMNLDYLGFDQEIN